MPLDLDVLQQRIVGALVEKERTVPETYPLTVNALVAAVNQKSNRDPQMTVEEYEVEGALRSLMEKGWITQLEREGGRTRRYAHDAERQLAVDAHEMALLAELMNRGPQSPSELRLRASRMKPFTSDDDVERRLEALAARPVPYVRRLERRSRERYARWTHLLGAAPGPSESSSEDAPSRAVAPSSSPPAPSRPAAAHALRDDDGLADRLARLEQEVSDLRDRLDRLEGR
jgi:uncharacterized protein YceH (UPF0502 family)